VAYFVKKVSRKDEILCLLLTFYLGDHRRSSHSTTFFTLGGQACQLYIFYFRITNLARRNVVFISSDGIPQKGSLIGARRIVEIKKTTLSNAPVTFQVKSGNNLLLLNTKPGLTIIPGKDVKQPKQPLSLTITGDNFGLPFSLISFQSNTVSDASNVLLS
jgi:hypothetical protein